MATAGDDERRLAATDFTDFGAGDFGATCTPTPRQTRAEHLSDLRSGDAPARELAAIALQGFRDDEVVLALVVACGDATWGVRRMAWESLRVLRPDLTRPLAAGERDPVEVLVLSERPPDPAEAVVVLRRRLTADRRPLTPDA